MRASVLTIKRLGQARHADQQAVAAGEDGGEDLLDDVVLADDDLLQFFLHQPPMLAELLQNVAETAGFCGWRRQRRGARCGCCHRCSFMCRSRLPSRTNIAPLTRNAFGAFSKLRYKGPFQQKGPTSSIVADRGRTAHARRPAFARATAELYDTCEGAVHVRQAFHPDARRVTYVVLLRLESLTYCYGGKNEIAHSRRPGSGSAVCIGCIGRGGGAIAGRRSEGHA